MPFRVGMLYLRLGSADRTISRYPLRGCTCATLPPLPSLSLSLPAAEREHCSRFASDQPTMAAVAPSLIPRCRFGFLSFSVLISFVMRFVMGATDLTVPSSFRQCTCPSLYRRLFDLARYSRFRRPKRFLFALSYLYLRACKSFSS